MSISVLPQEALKTLKQLPEPAMRKPMIRGVLLTAAAILIPALVIGGLLSLVGGLLAWFGIGSGIGMWSVVGYLFVPAAALVVGFLVDPVADAVEAKHFADAPPADPRPLSTDLSMSAKFVALALLINIPLLPFYWLFPPLPAAINGYLLGSEYFEMVARRRDNAAETAKLRRSVRGSMWLAGALLAFLITIPFVNLAAPVLGMGLITHVYHRARVRALR